MMATAKDSNGKGDNDKKDKKVKKVKSRVKVNKAVKKVKVKKVEIQAKAKPCLQNAPLRLPRPGLGQATAVQKHPAGLGEAAVFAVVAVAEAGAVGGAVGQPVDGLRHGVGTGGLRRLHRP